MKFLKEYNKEDNTCILPKQHEVLIKDSLYVAYNHRNGWLDFAFLFPLYVCPYIHEDIKCGILFHGTGFLEMGECRHTYWGENGYVFYPEIKQITTALKWLEEQGFDLSM